MPGHSSISSSLNKLSILAPSLLCQSTYLSNQAMNFKCPNISDSTMEEVLYGHEWEPRSSWLSWQWHFTEWHLKYHKDEKVWHSHTNTGTATFIPDLQHIRSSSEGNLAIPCPSSSCLLVPQVCQLNCFYVELKIGLTKATGVKTMLERKGCQEAIQDLKENSVWEYFL